MYWTACDESFEPIRVELAELEQKVPKSSRYAICPLIVRVHGLSKASTLYDRATSPLNSTVGLLRGLEQAKTWDKFRKR